ncbi:tetratricopeptide repeat protein [Flagellimonas sp. S174]|uniref:tetratricopeptide repeat protein n=1 Tax=Flagellimonas sp. S174 TaxID=3410790 RepID=UPI003BF4ECB8
MKKKLYLTMFAGLMAMGLSMAQAQNPECMTNLSIYAEHAKVKNYDAAYEPWKMVYESCPDINKANFSYGERILKHKIKNTSGADKDGFIQDCLELYDNSLKYFPDKYSKAEVIIDKVLLRFDNKMVSDDEIYAELGTAFKEDRKNFKNPKALYLYFSSLVDLHGSGKKELQEVFDVYDDVTEKVAEENKKLTGSLQKLLAKEDSGTALTSKEKRRLKAYTTNSQSYGKIATSIDSKLGALADCGNLIPLYEKSFESKKTDVNWVKRAVGRMFSKECTDDPMFQKLFEAQLALDPSADAYLYGGTLKQKAGDNKGAIADFNKAVELETDPYRKSNILYKIATTVRRSSKSQARSYAQKAINANASNGKAYLLIANLYAGSANACGTTPFEKRAIYWKAAEMARKAGRVDPSLSGRANKSAASYAAKAPTKEMIFNSGMAGKTVTFSCWVGGSVKVPNL